MDQRQKQPQWKPIYMLLVLGLLVVPGASGADTPAVPAADPCGPLEFSCWVNYLWGLMTNLADIVVPGLQTTFNTIKDTFDTLTSNGASVIDRFLLTINSVPSRTLSLSDDLVSRIEDGVGLAKGQLQSQDLGASDYGDFVDGEGGCSPTCNEFRDSLADLLRKSAEVANLGNEVLGAQLSLANQKSPSFTRRVDVEAAAEALERTPGFLLYPLFVVLNDPSLASSMGLEQELDFAADGHPPTTDLTCSGGDYCGAVEWLNGQLDEADTQLRLLEEMRDASASVSNGITSLGLQDRLCTWIMEPTDRVVSRATVLSTASYSLMVVSKALHLIAGVLEAAGVAGMEISVNVGYAAGADAEATIKWRPARRWAHVLMGVVHLLDAVEEMTLLRVRDCRTRVQGQMILCAMEEHTKTFRDSCAEEVLRGDGKYGF